MAPPTVMTGMNLAPSLHRKILSHRLRGFAEFEHSPSALKNACRTDIPYIEIDTRVSRDGVIFVYHDPRLGPEIDLPGLICRMNAKALAAARFRNGEPLFSLREFLRAFADQGPADTQLCIDIKDYGFEREHLDAVRESGLEHRVVFVSWIPQVLLALRKRGTTAPVVLSQVNVMRFGVAGRACAAMFRHARMRFSHFVLLGDAQFEHPLHGISHGYQHVYLCTRLSDRLLAGFGEARGICLHASLLSPALEHYCKIAKIRLWVFSARTEAEFLRLASRPGVDVVFSDNARRLLRA